MVRKIGSNDLVRFSATNQEIKILGSCVVKIMLNKLSWNVKFIIAKDLEWEVILGTPFSQESNK